MKSLIHSSPFKKGAQVILSLLLLFAALGNGVVHASGSCVHPTGAGHCFSSIQAAVDAAEDGEQITIRPGKYVEQVTIIGKNLTLVGRQGAVIQAPEAMADTLSLVAPVEGRPIILAAEAQVVIRDLVIDGRNSGANNPFLFGIAYINADGVIRDNVVKNVGFGEPNLDFGFMGEGISVVNFGETPRTVTIAQNHVINFNTTGITVFGQTLPGDPTPAELTAYVVDNTVVGSGRNDLFGQWGIFFGGYAPDELTPELTAIMTGTLKGNHVRDMITPDQPLSPGTGLNTKDLMNVEISDNVVENVNLGLILSGQYLQVMENRFRKMDTGIMLFVETPPLVGGSVIGTVLEDNRFENVAMDLFTTDPMMFEMPFAAAVAEPGQAQPKRLPR